MLFDRVFSEMLSTAKGSVASWLYFVFKKYWERIIPADRRRTVMAPLWKGSYQQAKNTEELVCSAISENCPQGFLLQECWIKQKTDDKICHIFSNQKAYCAFVDLEKARLSGEGWNVVSFSRLGLGSQIIRALNRSTRIQGHMLG